MHADPRPLPAALANQLAPGGSRGEELPDPHGVNSAGTFSLGGVDTTSWFLDHSQDTNLGSDSENPPPGFPPPGWPPAGYPPWGHNENASWSNVDGR
jgi:hypothetical protein